MIIYLILLFKFVINGFEFFYGGLFGIEGSIIIIIMFIIVLIVLWRKLWGRKVK